MSSFSNFHQCRVLFYRRLRILNQQLRERERQEKEGLDPKIQVESKLSIVNTFCLCFFHPELTGVDRTSYSLSLSLSLSCMISVRLNNGFFPILYL